jgi:hypothetical protein
MYFSKKMLGPGTETPLKNGQGSPSQCDLSLYQVLSKFPNNLGGVAKTMYFSKKMLNPGVVTPWQITVQSSLYNVHIFTLWSFFVPSFMKILQWLEEVKLIRYQFWCTRCAFRLLMLRSKKLEIREKKLWKLKEPSDENQTERHEIEPNPSKDRTMPEGDNPSFWNDFTNFTFFLTVQFIFVF